MQLSLALKNTLEYMESHTSLFKNVLYFKSFDIIDSDFL